MKLPVSAFSVRASGYVLVAVVAIAVAIPVSAQLDNLPNQFQPGETAAAAEVNQNFEALLHEVQDLRQEVSELEAELETVQSSALFDEEIEEVLENVALFTEIYFDSPDDTAVQGPIIRITGANLQIVNAAGVQEEPDGTGNLVVGYSEARGGYSDEVCSMGTHDTENECVGYGHTWAQAHNTGSHNIVGGSEAAYSQTGGLVIGRRNAITRAHASVTGGFQNLASGNSSSVTGGRGNESTAHGTTVTGGRFNKATRSQSVVSGGLHNVAHGNQSTVVGGSDNLADSDGFASIVVGGRDNVVNDWSATVTGGRNNTASAEETTISGGVGCELTENDEWGATELDGTGVGDCE